MFNQTRKNRTSHKLLAIILAAIFVLSGSIAIFSTVFGEEAPLTHYPLSIVDASGYTLVMQRAPERIVSLNPATTEILFASGFGSKVVGVTTNCDYPPEVSRIAKVGDMNIDIEALIRLQPDLVVGMIDLQPDTLKRIRDIGIKVLMINPTNSTGILSAIETVGIICGDAGPANRLILNIRSRLSAVTQRVAGRVRPRVFIEIWNDPLMTAGGDTFLNEIISLAGGSSISSGLSGWPVISNEYVISQNPSVILLTCYNKVEAMSRVTWQRISAVSSNRVYEVDANLAARNGPRFIDAIESFAAIFHPEVFR